MPNVHGDTQYRPELTQGLHFPFPTPVEQYKNWSCRGCAAESATFILGIQEVSLDHPVRGNFNSMYGYASCADPRHLAHQIVRCANEYSIWPVDVWVGKITDRHPNLFFARYGFELMAEWLLPEPF